MAEKDAATTENDPLKGTKSFTELSELFGGKVPIKLVTGTQTSQGLTFDLKPGAIVAHPGSAVVFVCG